MPKEIKSDYKKCDGCGGNLIFSPSTQGLHCEKCGKEIDFPKKGISEKHPIEEFSKTQNNLAEWQSQNKVLKCAMCGASIVLNSLEYASNCPYCGSAMLSLSDELPGIPPDAIIPFAFDEKAAAEKFKNTAKKKLLAPNAFKKKLPTSKIRGVYIPSFTFDANTFSVYDGVLEEDYTVTNSKGERVTKTRSFGIRGKKNLTHKDIMIETSSKINQSQLSQLLPFDHRYTYAFDKNFIRGYVVEHYNEETRESYKEAKAVMESNIRSMILKQYSYDRVRYLNVNTIYSDEKFLYKVCPIYSFEYTYKNKEYITLMNGQTGKVGKGMPVSKVKVGFLIAGIILSVVLIIIIIALVQGGVIGQSLS